MDMLYQRYACPFSFMDGMIQSGRLFEFVTETVKANNAEKQEETQWQFYLHKVFEKSYQEFKNELEQNERDMQMSEEDIETAIKQTIDLMNTFNPFEGGEQ